MKKLILKTILLIGLSGLAQDTLKVTKNGTLELTETKSIHFVKTEKETIYVGCNTPTNVRLRKQSQWVWVIFNDNTRKKYFLKWV